MITIHLDVTFDLDFSLCCGQVFRWQKIGDLWYGVVGKTILKIRQTGGELEFEGSNEEFVRHYFGLNDDLEQIRQGITKDNYIKKALNQFEGLRLIRQEPWACLISFICSTYKNIAAIEQMLKKLSEKYGEKQMFDGKEFYLFPTVESLATASESGLRECGLGYRAKYVQLTSRKVRDEKIDLPALTSMSYLEAKKRLLEFQGVGLKVADCVLLFSLEKFEAFPVDVWVKRVILNHYANHLPPEMVKKMQSHSSLTNGEYLKIGEFARDYFGRYAGYAQEYLYHYERTQR
ncbi:MAG: 8-oxoguanine DNA glycosylase [Nitrososphaerota archaeon]|jgi:N-glycosylase/DNA lyase|nr:8-oxoguanine DNA glycosylase [Nitrososphaerota archaeon]